MSLYLDHIFIITQPGAAEADKLLQLGWVEGNSNAHPGQGTTNRRFFLNGFMVELLYVCDEHEAANGPGRHLGILARSKDPTACPFGLVVRVQDPDTVPSFPSWEYHPAYFKDEWFFYVGKNSTELHEPLCICMPPELPKAKAVPVEYANPDWRFSQLHLHLPSTTGSAVLNEFGAIDKIQLHQGEAHHLQLTFNDGDAKRWFNAQPGLPLMVFY
jgi:hypothetical protein